MDEMPKQLPSSEHAETRFILGAILAVSVVVAFVLILHFA